MKLHLGCGSRVIPGFVHIDAVPWPHVEVVHAIDSLPMVGSESVSLIYACHVLEHFDRRELPRLLAEWLRVLQPGGVLRVAVPDFEAVVKVYAEQKLLEDVLGLLFGRGDYIYNIHRTTFDFTTLQGILEKAGFVDSHRYAWQDTEHAHIDDYSQAYLPHFDRENGTLMSLNLEATKP